MSGSHPHTLVAVRERWIAADLLRDDVAALGHLLERDLAFELDIGTRCRLLRRAAGAAGRLAGVTPADLALLALHPRIAGPA